MNRPAHSPNPPPRLTMDEYADWIEHPPIRIDPEMARKQKDLEERITHRFSLKSEAPQPDTPPSPRR